MVDYKNEHYQSKRQADDSLQLNDRLKEKLEHVMEEHVSEMSNMTCFLREMNVLNSRNNIDIAAMKADTENYNVSIRTAPCRICHTNPKNRKFLKFYFLPPKYQILLVY